MKPAVVIFAETYETRLKRPVLEVVSEARRIADALGGTVHAVLVGVRDEALASQLAQQGADYVHVFGQPALAAYATEPYARAVAKVATDTDATAVLFSMTALGKDLAPRVAAKLDAGLVSDCISLSVSEGRLTARRAMYSGKALATCEWTGGVHVASLRPSVFRLGATDPNRGAETLTEGIDDTSARAKVVGREARDASTVELTEAQIVVSGGRGLKGPEHFHLIDELAAAMGAAVGASRAVVDSGWKEHPFQVGQTGKTVSPAVYVACAISGAIQHLAGMSSSKVIVAINKDPEAPIFKVANYGIVGDVFEVLPQLTKAAEAYFSGKD
jgi:electron transfer flavoprotein alpha subunit